MRSIVYAGRDFGEYCTAEVVGRSVTPVVAEAMAVPGRAGALLVSGYVPPVDVVVRLFLDVGFKADVVRLAEIRHLLAFWLCVPGGGDLVLPDEPGRVYRDALLVDAGAWDELFSDGKCDLTFTLFDPIAYGDERVELTTDFEVGGTWQTHPVFTITTGAGPAIELGYLWHNKRIRVEGGFAAGDVIIIDCGAETVSVNGVDARDRVTLGSDFFAFEPGEAHISCLGFFDVETRFFERWV